MVREAVALSGGEPIEITTTAAIMAALPQARKRIARAPAPRHSPVRMPSRLATSRIAVMNSGQPNTAPYWPM